MRILGDFVARFLLFFPVAGRGDTYEHEKMGESCTAIAVVRLQVPVSTLR